MQHQIRNQSEPGSREDPIDIDLIECAHCGNVWDGNSQCPCTEPIPGMANRF